MKLNSLDYYYHLTQNRAHNIGDILDNTKGNESPYWNRTFACTNRVFTEFQKIYTFLEPFLEKQFDPQILQNLFKELENSLSISKAKSQVLHECIFESIRTKINKNLPSRYSSLYFFKSETDLIKLAPLWGMSDQKYKILKLKNCSKGNITFLGDSKFLNCGLDLPPFVIKKAEEYWKGVQMDSDPHFEILAVGKFEVCEILNLPASSLSETSP